MDGTVVDGRARARALLPDGGDLRVQEFTAEGEFVMGFGWGVEDGAERQLETCTTTCHAGVEGPPGQFEKPRGAAAAPSGCPIYVSDGDANELVDEFGACGGSEPPQEPPQETPHETPQSPPSTGNGSNGSTATVPASGGGPSSTGESGKSSSASGASGAEDSANAVAGALGLSSAKACFSRRTFDIHIHQPRGYPRVVSAEVFLGKQGERTLSAKRITVQIVLRGVPSGAFTIRIVARTVSGGTLTGTRTYHTCKGRAH